MSRTKGWFKGQFSFFMASPGIIWQILFLCVPCIIILFLSVVDASSETLRFSLAQYVHFFNPLYFRVIFRSFALAFGTTILCFICAYPLAYYMAFYLGRYKNSMLFFLLLPFWTNLLVLAYAWYFVLEKHGLINTVLVKLGIVSAPITLLNTPLAVYIVMLYCYLPFMTLPIYAILEKLDTRLVEASLDLGASPLQTLRYVIMPLSLSGIRTAFFLVFIPAYGEFVIPSLLGGAKNFYVGSLITHYLIVSRNLYKGAAFTCLSSLLLAIVAFSIYRWFRQITPVKDDSDQGPYYEKE